MVIIEYSKELINKYEIARWKRLTTRRMKRRRRRRSRFAASSMEEIDNKKDKVTEKRKKSIYNVKFNESLNLTHVYPC